MVNKELAVDRWMIRRRWRLDGSTPIRRWKLLAGDSAGGSGGVSARKIAASVWRLCAVSDDGGSVRRRGRRWGVFGDGINFELCPSLANVEIEGVTKWDFCYSKTFVDLNLNRGKDMAPVAVASSGHPARRKAKKCVKNLGAEGGLTTKIHNCIKELDEERGSGLNSEYQKIAWSIVQNLVDDIKRERDKCKRMEVKNSKLLRDIARTKSLTRKLVKGIETEKRARNLLEEACNELAKVVEGSKAEMIELRNQYRSFQENAEEERKIMQMGEGWQEEHMQQALVKAKSIVEDKFGEMDSLITDAEKFSKSNSTVKNVMNKPRDDASGKSCVLSNMSGKQAITRDEVCMSNSDAGSIRNTTVASKELRKKESSKSNPHVVRAMKGHIVWPRGIQRHGWSAGKQLEAKLESQRMLIRNILKTKV